ncbi:MAG: hypothetical protein Q8N47_14080 [Bryobacterales bacterium]|nr:hypothetical protein [Bryobacterales bacterium]
MKNSERRTACAILLPMKPLFTIHAGEYLVGLHVQKSLKLNAWIPAKDIGIDLLVTDSDNLHAVSLQVKYGKDFLPEMKAELRSPLRCVSWFTLNRAKLDTSQAQFWVFVLQGFKSDAPDFVVIPTAEVQRRMTEIHGSDGGKLQSYFCSTENNQCWETRRLRADDMKQIANGTFEDPARDFTKYLNENGWAAVANKLKS